jgi:type VI secretion system secreted protein VgrG
MLDDLEATGKTVTIVETNGGNKNSTNPAKANKKADGTPGPGADSTLSYNPDKKGTGAQPWQKRPAAIGLAHELVHSTHAAKGERSDKSVVVPNDSKPDPADPSKIATMKEEEVRTVGIKPYDNEPYSENKIRDEWTPKQPERKWY